MTSFKLLVAASGLSLAAFSAHAAPVDLSSWVVNTGSGSPLANWTVQGVGNDSVFQSVNSAPSIFFNSGVNAQGQSLKGTIKVETTSDNDFIGFVLGYNAGDVSNASADYLLIDWRQADQSDYLGCTSTVGMAISRVSGPLGDNQGAWCHNSANNVTELARATTLGSTGWADNTEYTFDVEFTATLVKVKVNNVEELSITGSFADGAFGFYNYSQTNVRYAGITQVQAPSDVPVPMALPLMASGLGALGFLGMRRRKG